MKTVIYFFLFILCLCHYSYGQHLQPNGTPFMEVYNAADYGANNQNWSVVQDQRGVMYFGNTNGILVFDGANWNVIKIATNSTVRSLTVDSDGTVYAAGNGDFGLLEADSNGKMQYRSLAHKAPPQFADISDVRQVCASSHGVYFFLDNAVFRYSNDTIDVIDFSAKSLFAFTVNNEIFAVDSVGIYHVYKGKMQVLPASQEIVENSGRLIITEFDNENILIITENNGLFLYNTADFFNTKKGTYNFSVRQNPKITQPETEVNAYIRVNQIYSAQKIDKETIAIGTVLGGMVFMDNTFQIVRIFNKDRGLQDNAIIDIFQDRDKNLWLAHLSGISYIHNNAPISQFAGNEKLEGSVYSIVEHDNKIFAGTPLGLFYISSESIMPQFKMFNNATEATWDFEITDSWLLAAARNYIFLIKDDKFYRHKTGLLSYFIHKSKLFDNQIFVGHRNGLSAYNYSFNDDYASLSQRFDFEEITASVRKIITIRNNLWLTTSYNGVSCTQFDSKEIESYKTTHYDTTSGFPGMAYNYVIDYKKDLVIGTAEGLYTLVDNQRFVKKNILDAPILDSLGVNKIIERNGKTWVLTANSIIGYLEYDKATGTHTINRSWLTKLRNYQIYDTFFDSNNRLWLSTNNGAVVFDTNKEPDFDQKFSTLITQVTIGNDSVIYSGTTAKKNAHGYATRFVNTDNRDKPFVFDFKHNSIKFEFASTFFEQSQYNSYNFYLEGFENNRNHYTKERVKEYNYLREGEYTFYVKSVNIYGRESETAVFSFVIKPPFYRSYLAYFIYSVLSLAFIRLIIYLYTRRLKAANKRLEEKVQERTAEIREKNQKLLLQKEEIQTQADQLEYSNKELEKLSIVAAQTDNSVIITDAEGNFEWTNPAFERLYGYSLKEFIAKFGNNIESASRNKKVRQLINRCKEQKESILYESDFVSKSGKVLWLQTALTPIIDEQNEIRKLIAVETDISKLKEYEIEIVQKNEEIITQNEELQTKNELLKEQKNDIQAGIRYALTIQKAMLPEKEHILNHFEVFILYKPKDIVSGDFYWFLHVPKTLNNKEHFYVAAVDCTGHGVPGAFMSMIANRLLNEIVNEKKITAPKDILNHMHNAVVKALKQETSDNHDGMDLILCRIEKQTDENYRICFSGAKRPLIYFSKSDNNIKQIKTDRFSIGGIHFDKKIFAENEIILSKGDIIYLTSDGYIDQNNIGRKRLGTVNFLDLLQQNAHKSMQQQHEVLEQELFNWKENEPQRDDIVIVGLKL